MDGITVMRRPESVSWEAVSRVLKEAHRENVRRGIRMTYPQLPPEQLYEKTEGRGGVLFVALDGERLVGTAAVVTKPASLVSWLRLVGMVGLSRRSL